MHALLPQSFSRFALAETLQTLAFYKPSQGGYKSAPSVPVPVPPTFVELAKSQIAEAKEGVQALFYQILKEVEAVSKGQKPLDAPFIVMMSMILLFFGVVILTFASVFTGPAASQADKAATAAKKDK